MIDKELLELAAKAAARIKQLEAENEQLIIYKNLADEYGLSVFADLAELQKQRDELLKDAERYRWLRSDFESNIVVVTGLDTIDYGSSGVAATYEYALCLEELDAAIDAAIASVKGGAA